MWGFSNNAFVSAVAHRDIPGKLMVRARFEGGGDLQKVFGDGVPVAVTPRWGLPVSGSCAKGGV